MNNIVLQKTWVQGRPVVVDNLLGTAFTGEAGAHTFKIRGVDAAQETVTISGTITGKLLAANNVTISLSGSIEDGCAVVTLTDECYDVPGRFIFSVYATSGSTTLCLYCAVGNVLRTDSQVIAYPTESLPNITSLMADLEQILADWPADYSQLQSDVSSLKSAVVDVNSYYGGIITAASLVDNRAWTLGAYLQSSTGAVTEATSYRYQYVRIQQIGVYTTYRQSSFGSQRYLLPLYNTDKEFVKSVACSTYDSNASNVHFTITKQDFLDGVRYVGISSNNIDLTLVYNGDIARASEHPYPVWTIDRALVADKALVADALDKLSGKTIACDGDSICAGYRDRPDNLGGWFGRLVARYGMTGTNYAVSGGAITSGLTFLNGDPRHSVVDTIDSIYSNQPNVDYIILEGGVNDADVIGRITEGTIPEAFGEWSESKFFDVSSSSNLSTYYDKETFCGAVDMLFYKATSLFAGKKIGFIIPMQMGTSFSSQKNRRAYFDELIKIADKWHIPVLDLWKFSTMDARTIAYYDSSLTESENISGGKYYADGQHPTSAGYDLMMDKILHWIESL